MAAVLLFNLEILIREHAKGEQTRKCRAQFEDEEGIRRQCGRYACARTRGTMPVRRVKKKGTAWNELQCAVGRRRWRGRAVYVVGISTVLRGRRVLIDLSSRCDRLRSDLSAINRLQFVYKVTVLDHSYSY